MDSKVLRSTSSHHSHALGPHALKEGRRRPQLPPSPPTTHARGQNKPCSRGWKVKRAGAGAYSRGARAQPMFFSGYVTLSVYAGNRNAIQPLGAVPPFIENSGTPSVTTPRLRKTWNESLNQSVCLGFVVFVADRWTGST
jgi:hypothetical protein